ncbi:MAG: hypothetical protein DRQ88_11280 [Epsilonproteobacteria bacterium]|nr:MAG: hypothetical protein DRQ89_06635 [Campylobacterota bacterium]RLA64265.1 MAG: hypothetical protein DRQ88_11280 [Campylobacterota bacterium]
MSKFFFNITIPFILSLPLAFGGIPSESQLGLEDSFYLKMEIKERFLNSHGGLDSSKIQKFKVLNIKMMEEYKNIIIQNNLSEGFSLEKAEKKVKKDKIIGAIDLIIKTLDEVSLIEDQNLTNFNLKNILRLYYGLKGRGENNGLAQMTTAFYSMLFQSSDVPLSDLKRPFPSNLLDIKNKRYFSKEELKEMVEKGADLSLIDPPHNTFWRKPENISGINPLAFKGKVEAIPQEFFFKKFMNSGTKPKLKIYHLNPDGKEIKWKIKFGREVHTEFVSSKLMALLGYYTDKYVYVKDFKIYFKDKKEFDSSINKWLSHDRGGEGNLPKKFILDKGLDDKGYWALFNEGLLEGRPKNVTRLKGFHFSQMGNWERREVRAQLLIQAFVNNTDIRDPINNKVKIIKNKKGWEIQELIHDVGYSFGGNLISNAPNAYPNSFLKRGLRKIKIKYNNNHLIKKQSNPFLNTSYSDLKWIGRYFAQITEEQLETIVKASGWPDEVGKLFLEKMKKKRNEIVRIFELDGEIVEGRVIKLFSEVNLKKFNYGHFIRKGKLIKKFESKSSVNFLKNESFPLTFSKIFESLILSALKATEEIPYHEMIKFPLRENGFTIKEFNAGLGVGFRVNRVVKRNPNATTESEAWATHDTLEIFGTIGAGGFFPIINGLQSDLEVKFFLGKQFTLVYYSPTHLKAVMGNFKKLVSAPFKKKKMINSLKNGEAFGFGSFLGFEIETGFGNTGMVRVGLEVELDKKFLNKTLIYKSEDAKYEVTRAKRTEFGIGISGFIEFFNIISIDLIKASILFGKEEGKTYFLDLGLEDQVKAFNYLVYTSKDDTSIEEIPYSETTKKYIEGNWTIGFLSSMGGESRWIWEVTRLPDGKYKRYFNYFTQIKTYRFFVEEGKNYQAKGKIEFADKGFTKILNRSLSLSLIVDDGRTTVKDVRKLKKKVDNIVGKKGFFAYSPELYTTNHFEKTHLDLSIDITPGGLKCIFEKVGCLAKGPKAYKVGNKLKAIRSKKSPIKKMVAAANLFKRSLLNEGKFADIRKFLGPGSLKGELLFSGHLINDQEFLQIKF